jgi:HEAT repeat protein
MRYQRVSVCAMLFLSLLGACKKKDTGPNIPGLIQALKSENSEVRGPAQVALISLGEPAAAPVAELLRDPEDRIRLSAAQTLWGLGAQARSAVPQLTLALGDSMPEVRANAAMALEAIGPAASTAVSALAERLGDKDWNVRQHAARALGAMGPAAKSAVPALNRAARDDFTRSAASEALRKIQGTR